MTLLCGGLHNEARVPEFRLPAGNISTHVIPAVKPMQHLERSKAGIRLCRLCCNMIHVLAMKGVIPISELFYTVLRFSLSPDLPGWRQLFFS